MELLEEVCGSEYLKEIENQCLCRFHVQELGDDPAEDLAIDDLGHEELEAQAMGVRPDAGGIDGRTYGVPQVIKVQENEGGTLGKNLISGEIGQKGTFLTHTIRRERNGDLIDDINEPDGRYFTEDTFGGEFPRKDTSSGFVGIVVEEEWKKIHGPLLAYPYTVAAHHLIPGNESLARSALWNYMNKTGRVRHLTKAVDGDKKPTDEAVKAVNVEDHGEFKIVANIGYNVNGVHNGVWLPGSYAMKRGTNPDGTACWLEQDPAWRASYERGVVSRTRGQFHDRHPRYSFEVMDKLLDALAKRVEQHIKNCDECKEKRELPPPYPVVLGLFKISAWLRRKLGDNPAEWLTPFVTAERWQARGKLDEMKALFVEKPKLRKEQEALTSKIEALRG